MLETRLAIADDAALISAHRRAMFAEMGGRSEEVLDTLCKASEPWTRRMILENKYCGWIVCDASRPVASAGLMILDWAPHPLDPTSEHRGYILNVFVDFGYRKQGLARKLVELCMADARRRNIRLVSLHASDAGRPIYEKLGFHTTNEMLFEYPLDLAD